MAGDDREWTGRAGRAYGEELPYGRESYQRPSYVRGLQRTPRWHPETRAPRRRRPVTPEPERRGRDYGAAPAAEYGREYERWGERWDERGYGREYGRAWNRGWRGGRGGRGPERRRRPRGWRRWRTVPASEVPRGEPERWWHAIGPERRQDYAWAFGARRPERYGWTGETGRDGGPDRPHHRRPHRRRHHHRRPPHPH